MVMVMDSFEAFRLLCSSICQSSLKIVWQPAKKRVQHFRNPSNMGILWICCYSSHRRERRVSQICIIDSSFSLTWNLHIKIWCNSLSVFPRLSFFDVAFVALKIAPCSFRKIYNNIRKLILSLRPISDASHCCTDIKCCEVFFLFSFSFAFQSPWLRLATLIPHPIISNETVMEWVCAQLGVLAFPFGKITQQLGQ